MKEFPNNLNMDEITEHHNTTRTKAEPSLAEEIKIMFASAAIIITLTVAGLVIYPPTREYLRQCFDEFTQWYEHKADDIATSTLNNYFR